MKKILSKLYLRNNNISFKELCSLLQYFNFYVRIKGSHNIFTREDVEEIINIQPNKEGKAKPYQIKQVRYIFHKYQIGISE